MDTAKHNDENHVDLFIIFSVVIESTTTSADNVYTHTHEVRFFSILSFKMA